MLHIFMKSPLPNSLAVLVLIALVFAWVSSLALVLREKPVEREKGWFAWLLPVFALLGLPATADLLQTSGLPLLFGIIVTLALLLNIAVPVLRLRGQTSPGLVRDWAKWTGLVCAVAGIVLAGYLTYTHYAGRAVMCGPSGGCDTVQNSKYAVLFGILPVAVLGLAGYIGILAAWLAWQYGPAGLRNTAAIAMWGMCLFGVLFTIYLTTLEPFVIGATCMWCIASAILQIILLWVSTPVAQQALAPQDEEGAYGEFTISD